MTTFEIPGSRQRDEQTSSVHIPSPAELMARVERTHKGLANSTEQKDSKALSRTSTIDNFVRSLRTELGRPFPDRSKIKSTADEFQKQQR